MADRLIRDELLNSERYWAVCDEAKLLYLHLILSVDDTARYSAKNFTLRTRCFSGRGMEPSRMESLLSELMDQDLIRLYHVNDDRFVFIPRFKQRLRYVNSKYPEPPIEINDLHIKKTDLGQTQDRPKTDPSRQKRSEVKRSEVNLGGAIAPKTSKGKRFDLQEIPTEWIEFCNAEREDLNPKDVFNVFKDYWVSQPGQKGVKVDWLATWRNWVRTQKQGNAKPKQNLPAYRKTEFGHEKWQPTLNMYTPIAFELIPESERIGL